MSSNEPVEYVLWSYTPSVAGGVIASLVFCALFLFHSWRLFRTKLWFCTPFVVGALFETIGYAARAAAANDSESITPYVIQSLLILLAPILFAASIYMILGRLIRMVEGERYSMVRVKWLTKIFVSGDVLCFLMQSTGGGLMAKAENQDNVDMAENIILGGLVLQILIFGFFVVVASVFHKRLAHNPTPASYDMNWKRFMLALYTVSALITARNFARCVEYGMGKEGYLLQNEWCLYIYDFLLMFICLIVSIIWYKLSAQDTRVRGNNMHSLGQQNYGPNK
ncbi:uncharacterized protein HMPREF1541_03505 [Cyphellophora europaea CBS 101466]|uniref:RTA1 domain protein n=1 Tax=Cyphellophora europaea (strain CBS 101466) TaxID=1220924 RepID=W2S0U1_CYPE1|nr:uncharacterized protein HMPREF1541_03505 [Cyphellophora europaea CBS 101466]ETN41569.1 hypothetical protein HMPREF1541_03505 [Cyphellophora europaea CBS 101466]